MLHWINKPIVPELSRVKTNQMVKCCCFSLPSMCAVTKEIACVLVLATVHRSVKLLQKKLEICDYVLMLDLEYMTEKESERNWMRLILM